MSATLFIIGICLTTIPIWYVRLIAVGLMALALGIGKMEAKHE